ncbi:MAG: TonB-dependent receptor [Bacteroidales bacterium]|jgi:iron complex outermembrane receptor protein|nr:TonB-dependent receptor [Bacteroidales bacterium]
MRYLLLLISLLASCSAFAGNPEPIIIDTVHLEEVTLVSDYRKFQPGAKIDRLDSQLLKGMAEANLDQALSRLSPVYVKGNAGGLSTIRFRGTSASHTSIRFGGIDINSLTLGHANASGLATYLFDGISLQYGGSSAINGSGSIGGTIYLEQQNKWTKGQKLNFSSTIGSFGEKFYGTKIYLGKGNWESVTKAYWFQKENNFYFNNPFHENSYTNPSPVRERQQGAAIENKGFLQEINYRFNAGANIKSSFWYEDNWHEIQPNMASNNKSPAELQDNNFRSWLEYENRNSPFLIKIGAGYVHDEQLYQKNEDQLIVTDRLLSEASASYKTSPGSEIKAGALYKYIVPDVYSYSKEVIDYEQQLDLYLSYYFEPLKDLRATVNVRQMLVSNFKAPFTPALVLEYKAASSPKQQLTLTGGLSRSYRIPTFNDRYWGTQGNPNLKPEAGINLEAGLGYLRQMQHNHMRAKVNLFYMDVDNWIEWKPGFVDWEAQNVERVISKGLELQLQATVAFNKIESQWGANYSYNPVKEHNKQKQLIYTPKHSANLYADLNWKKYGITADGSYIGERTQILQGQSLPGHFLTNLSLRYRLNYKEHGLQFTAQMLNIFDIDYQNEALYAMPGRAFKLNISIDLRNEGR